MTLSSVRHINHQRLVLRLDQRTLADTEAVGLCLLVAVCLAGGRGAGAGTQEGQHHLDIILIQFLSLVVKVVVMILLCQLVLRAPKKEGNNTFVGRILANYVAGTTYIRRPTQHWHILFWPDILLGIGIFDDI